MQVNSQTCPCRGCVAPRRHSTCHPFCKEYIEWKEQLNSENEKEKAEKENERMFSNFRREGVEKALKANGSHKRRRLHYK